MKKDNYPAMLGAFLLFSILVAISCLDKRETLNKPFQPKETKLDFRTEWFRIFGYIDFNNCTAHLDVFVDESGQLVHDPVGTLDHCDGFTGESELPFGFSAEPWEEAGLFRLTSPYLIRDSFLDLYFPGCYPQDTWTGIESLEVLYENDRWVMEVELEPAYQQCLEDNKNGFYLRFDVRQPGDTGEVEPHQELENYNTKK